MPEKAAGMRTEPPPSVPSESGAMPSATAAALPPEEPPDVRVGSHGLPVTPVRGASVTPFQPSSGVVVLPTSTAAVLAHAGHRGRVDVPRARRRRWSASRAASASRG